MEEGETECHFTRFRCRSEADLKGWIFARVLLLVASRDEPTDTAAGVHMDAKGLGGTDDDVGPVLRWGSDDS